ncbi:transglycosylase domain-containing protein [Pedobacter sp. SD-b]|uniref:Transglycosylase domain-containing protein n=1 Tax=Pedobacter segetis TaxID=2793069 RepID=A0ABS1BG74_9SPHI|nr:transglycosylase domain-containing protein [Pedobacter segetis]MBK0381869.1 transglycosylase domain-containing protein [Pedobacter segetis]
MFKEIPNKPIRYLTIVIYFIIIFVCAVELNFLGLFGYSPTKKDIKLPTLNVSSEVYTADSVLIGKYYTENRTPVDFNEIDSNVINALIATEDVRFYKHSGVDFYSLASGIVSTAGGDTRGGSTITQQLAKNLYRTRLNKSQGLLRKIPVIRTLVSKFKEWLTAFKLEANYKKNDIITMYLNTVPFGNNSYGINTAAKHYFNKPVSNLDVDEAAMLVGMLKATSTYNPIKNPENAIKRRNVVLAQMNKYKFLSNSQYQLAIKKPIKLDLGKDTGKNDGDSYLRSEVAKWLEKWCKDNDYNLYEDGLKIYTTIDSKLQKYAEEAVHEQMNILQKRFDNTWGNQDAWQNSEGVTIPDFIENSIERLPWYNNFKRKYVNDPDSIDVILNKKKTMTVFSWDGDKQVQFSTIDSIKYYAKILNTGMMTLDPFSGKIKVWVGGDDHTYFKYDHVIQSKRQAGSTFKPFAYLAALESGMSPCDKMTDKPVSISYKDGDQTKVWEPKNADYNFTYREMSLRWAMAKSVNSITAQVTEKVGWDKVVEYAHKCGIESPLKSVPSVSLGPNDVSVYEMVKAYGTFLNKGNKVDPILVEKITDQDGNLIEDFKAKQTPVLSKEIAWLMLYMFRGGMEEPGGTSQALWEWDLWKKNNQIGGKTGTSSDYVDGWYMGITKDLVTGVWVGADDRSVHFKTMQTGEGSRTALPIFAKFMEKVYKDPSTGITEGPFPKPEVPITRSYYCVSPRIVADTFSVDSIFTDSLKTDDPLPQPEENQLPDNNVTKENTTQKKEQVKPLNPTQNKEENKQSQPIKQEITKKEERKLKREERKNEQNN